MGARKKISIEVKDMPASTHWYIMKALELAGCENADIETLKIEGNEYYKLQIDSNDKLIRRILDVIEAYIKENGDHNVNKSELCGIVGISRPTLLKLERRGVIALSDHYTPSVGVGLGEISRQLKKNVKK